MPSWSRSTQRNREKIVMDFPVTWKPPHWNWGRRTWCSIDTRHKKHKKSAAKPDHKPAFLAGELFCTHRQKNKQTFTYHLHLKKSHPHIPITGWTHWYYYQIDQDWYRKVDTTQGDSGDDSTRTTSSYHTSLLGNRFSTSALSFSSVCNKAAPHALEVKTLYHWENIQVVP